MARLTIVYWRDIPAQVIVKAGRQSAKRQLDERFEKAIDRAAMRADLKDTDSYLSEWRRAAPVTCSDEHSVWKRTSLRTGCAISCPPAVGTRPEETMAMAAPNPERGTPDPHTDPGVDRKQEILDFVDGFTIETTPGSALKIPDYRDHLRPGATVSVTFLPGSDFADTVTTAKRLKNEGFKPAPHFAARSIPSRAAFESNLKRLRDEVGIEEVVALGGAVSNPVGEYESSVQLLETGLFDKYGVKRIGLAGHPEGSPDISDPYRHPGPRHLEDLDQPRQGLRHRPVDAGLDAPGQEHH
jgi:hypothetical protein